MLWGGREEQTLALGTERTWPTAGVGLSLSDSRDTSHYALPLSCILENQPRHQIWRSLCEKYEATGTFHSETGQKTLKVHHDMLRGNTFSGLFFKFVHGLWLCAFSPKLSQNHLVSAHWASDWGWGILVFSMLIIHSLVAGVAASTFSTQLLQPMRAKRNKILKC